MHTENAALPPGNAAFCFCAFITFLSADIGQLQKHWAQNSYLNFPTLRFSIYLKLNEFSFFDAITRCARFTNK